jgi:hypothetical protein
MGNIAGPQPARMALVDVAKYDHSISTGKALHRRGVIEQRVDEFLASKGRRSSMARLRR